MGRYDFEATTIESLDGFSLSTLQLITDLGRTIYRTLATRKRVVFVSSDYVLDAALNAVGLPLHDSLLVPDD